MTVADLARSVAEQNAFEAKKDAVRQVQSGDWRLTLTVKAGDLPTSVMTAAPGARYVVALVPIDDDEMPISGGGSTEPPVDAGGEDARVPASQVAPATVGAPMPGTVTNVTVHDLPKPRRRWSELSRAQRAGMRCAEAEFCRWLWAKNDLKWEDAMGDAAEAVRILCNVVSRTEFDTDAAAATRWDALEARFMQATGRMAVDR